jgi:hypothetical protein
MLPRPVLRLALVPLALVAAAGCGAPRTPAAARAAEAPVARIERVVVAPLNLGLRPPQELRGSEGSVFRELLRHLQAQDRPVSLLDEADAGALWDEAFAAAGAAGGKPEFRATATRFAGRLAQQTDFDLLVLPSLVLRRAEVGGRHAKWDGVRRRLPVRYANVEAHALANEVPGAGLWGYRGSVAAASLYVALLDRRGERVHEGLAGIDVVQELRPQKGTPGSAKWSLAPRLDAFADASNVREGVGLAFERRLETTAHRW